MINNNKGLYSKMGLGEFANDHSNTTNRVMKKTGGSIDESERVTPAMKAGLVEVTKKPLPKDRPLKKNVFKEGGRPEAYQTGLNGRPGYEEINNVGGAPTKAILKKGGRVRREHHDFGEDVGRAKKYAEDTFNKVRDEAPKLAKKVHEGASNALSKARDYFHFEEGGKVSKREKHDMGEMVGRVKSDAEDKFNQVKRGAEDFGNKIKHGAEDAWGKVRKAFHFEEGGPVGSKGKSPYSKRCGK